MWSSERGAYSATRAATDPEGNGAYFDKFAARKPASPPGQDLALARDLWSRSEQWTQHGQP